MSRKIIEKALEQGKGVVRLAPNWVPRSFCRPGRRLRLHPDDYFALGTERGGIDERWFSSTTPADNGPGTPENQGLSFIVTREGELARLVDAVSEFKGQIIGDALYKKYGRWPMYSKFFDNKGPPPHHIHHNDEYAAKVGEAGKPRCTSFPPSTTHPTAANFYLLRLQPRTTKEQVRDALAAFAKGQQADFCPAYAIDVDTGWTYRPALCMPLPACVRMSHSLLRMYTPCTSRFCTDHVVMRTCCGRTAPKTKGRLRLLDRSHGLGYEPDPCSTRIGVCCPAR